MYVKIDNIDNLYGQIYDIDNKSEHLDNIDNIDNLYFKIHNIDIYKFLGTNCSQSASVTQDSLY